MKLLIVGVGMGNPDTMTRGAVEAVQSSDCLIGSARLLQGFERQSAARFEAYSAEKIAAYLDEHPEFHTVCVLMSGDVGFYSGAKALCALFSQKPGVEIECVAGVSTVQYFCAKLCTPWEDAKLVSLHGREQNLSAAVAHHAKVFLLTGGQQSAGEICAILAQNGLGDVTVHVGERLSYPDETVTAGTAKELAGKTFAPLSVMLVQNSAPVERAVTYGLPEEAFLRGDAPMTKREVRTVSISALQPVDGDIIWDVGAGTGSVSIELARLLPGATVYAVEKQAAAVELLEANKERFGAYQLQIVRGEAPGALEALPAPDGVFVGGSSGELMRIIELALQKNPSVRIVVNAITLETLGEGLACFTRFGLRGQDVVQLCVSRSREVGRYHMMTGQNPVYILSGGGKADG